MADAQENCGEFVESRGVHIGIIDAVPRRCMRAQQRGKELVVGNRLQLRADDLTGPLIEVFLGPPGMGGGQLVDQAIVLSHEQRVEGCQSGVVIDAAVSRHEGRGQRRSEGVPRQQVLAVAIDVVAGPQLGPGVGRPAAEDRRRLGVRSIDHRGVEKRACKVSLLARVVDACSGGRVEDRPGQLDQLIG
jgi:hypothetical protein